MWIGLTCFGILADKKGRRIVYLLSMLCILVFGLLSAFCRTYPALLVMRLLVGVGVGGTCVSVYERACAKHTSPLTDAGAARDCLRCGCRVHHVLRVPADR